MTDYFDPLRGLRGNLAAGQARSLGPWAVGRPHGLLTSPVCLTYRHETICCACCFSLADCSPGSLPRFPLPPSEGKHETVFMSCVCLQVYSAIFKGTTGFLFRWQSAARCVVALRSPHTFWSGLSTATAEHSPCGWVYEAFLFRSHLSCRLRPQLPRRDSASFLQSHRPSCPGTTEACHRRHATVTGATVEIWGHDRCLVLASARGFYWLEKLLMQGESITLDRNPWSRSPIRSWRWPCISCTDRHGHALIRGSLFS